MQVALIYIRVVPWWLVCAWLSSRLTRTCTGRAGDRRVAKVLDRAGAGCGARFGIFLGHEDHLPHVQ
jgi:hypothetical protein